MAACWTFAGLVFIACSLETTLAMGGNVHDFNCAPSDRAPDGYQYISPSLTFPCGGRVTKWKIGVENRKNVIVYLQIWQSIGTDYSRVSEYVYNHTSDDATAEVLTDMTVSAGDAIGFFIPRNTRGNNVGLRLAWAPVPDHTLLQGVRSSVGVSPVATFTDSPTTLNSSPLVSVMFEPSATSCASSSPKPTPVSSRNDCISAFDDFRIVCGRKVASNAQYIIPELSFSCDGTVTQWKVGLEGKGNDQSVNLQIWRSVGPGEYTRVTEVVYTKTLGNERIATVPVSMSVMSGDMVGFYVPDKQLEPHTLPDEGLTMYTTGGRSTSSLSALQSIVGPSPLISVVFVPDVTGSSVATTTLAATVSSITESPQASHPPPATGVDDPSRNVSGAVVGAVVAAVIVLVVGSVIVVALLITWRARSGKAVLSGKVRHCRKNEQESKSGLINSSGEQIMQTHTTAAAPCMYEVPVRRNRSEHEAVVERGTAVAPMTWNPNSVVQYCEGAECEGSSAASSLFYQYVPSTRLRLKGVKPVENPASPALYAELESMYGSVYTESTYEDIPYAEPAEKVGDIFDQLAHEKCIEIPSLVLKTEAILGSGEFGEVFKGIWDTPYGPQEVAIKRLKEGSNDKHKATFLQEAAIMTQFKHPHVVMLLGAVTVDEPEMIVLEFLHKGDLKEFLHSQKTDPGTIADEGLPKQLLTFCQEIAEGMRYLSRRGFVHRDLAARNILLSKGLNCKIADFGLSKKLADDTEYYVTSGGKVPVNWTAPEALFYKKFSTRSDVWSYGMVMYEIWSLGKKPFSHVSVKMLVQKFRTKTDYIQPPPPGCPKAMYKVMVQCWKLDHHSRPSFSELCSSLKDDSDRGGSSLLDAPVQALRAVRDPARAAQLGAPLSCAQDLYRDLQQYYY